MKQPLENRTGRISDDFMSKIETLAGEEGVDATSLLDHRSVRNVELHIFAAAKAVLQLPGYNIPADQIRTMTNGDLREVPLQQDTVERLEREKSAALESLREEFHSRVEAVLA